MPKITTEKIKSALKILVVEDNKINQKLLTRILQKLGQKTGSAWNGQEALDVPDLDKYDAIFMDMQMSVMDGITSTQKIIEKWGAKRPIIYAMTANVMEEDRKKCLDAGMDGFLTKPIKKDTLIEALAEICVKIPLSRNPLSSKTESQVLNEARIESEFEGIFSVFREAADLFIADHVKLMTDIERDIESSEYQNLADSAHAIKGVFRTIHADKARDSAYGIEVAAKNNELVGMDELYEVLKSDVDNLLIKLEDLFLKNAA